MKFIVNDIFLSIQGEGLFAGKIMNFIRFCRCNLNCRWCDTNFSSGKEMFLEDIIKRLNEGVEWVSLTGGEPMLEENLIFLIDTLKKRKFKILLETNATIFDGDIFNLCDFISIDIKPPSSGNPGFDKKVLDFCIKHSSKSQIKVVLQNVDDFNFFKHIYKRYPNWILQPEWSSRRILDYENIIQNLTSEMLCDVRVIPQIHKVLGVR